MTNSNYKPILYLLMFNMFITMGGIGMIVPVMPAYLEVFGARGQIYGFLIATFSLSQFIFSPIIGNYSDRYSRKNIIITGLIIYGIAQVLFGYTDELWVLFVSRFMSGIGAAFIMPTILAYVGDITPLEDRGKGMSLVGAAISLGFTIGPGIGGGLAEINLDLPFYFAGMIAFITAILTFYMLPQQKERVSSLTQSPRDNIFKQMILSVKLPYFVFLVVVFTFSFGIANIQATMSLFLNDKFNYSPFLISTILVVSGVAGVIIQLFIINKLFARFGEVKIIMVNLMLAAVTLYLLIYVSGYFIILTVASLNAIAATLIRPAVNTIISKMAGDGQGFAAGVNNAYMSLGNMIGPICAGILYDWKMEAPYIFGTFILLSCFALTYIWSLKKSNTTEPAVDSL
ncbi:MULTISPECIES: MFS transporter [Solibacillus]|uniref:MFS transporter n=1 Tax=Solibacillus TaxID=648800 RepID=UPI002041EBB1|nr:MFS transporter [Solibacillus isronensis]MCM3721145.1 MFS transporter [Solibacillus isronensis]